MKLTLRVLRSKGACSDQLALFKELFGQGGEVTLEKVLGVADKFDWGWAASNLLSLAARADYKRVTTAAWFAGWPKDHERVAWADYERVRAAARADYERVRAAAWFAGWQKDHER